MNCPNRIGREIFTNSLHGEKKRSSILVVMKKLLTLLLFAVIIIACKKEDYSAGEYYKVTYQTIDNTMEISISATQDINPANFKGLKPDIKFKKAQYLISLYGEQSYKIDFIKQDGSVFPLELRASEKKMTLDF